jgi:hypothetical protein
VLDDDDGTRRRCLRRKRQDGLDRLIAEGFQIP